MPKLASAFSAPHEEALPSADAAAGGAASSEAGCEEAAGFARELDRELDSQAKTDPGVLAVCVGNRRAARQAQVKDGLRMRKGVKLDFKRTEAVEPALRYLRDSNAAKRLGGHLWLNADVFAGPGALLSPLDAKEFAQLCAEALPEAVLSLSWGSSIISTTRVYTSDMVESMLGLVMSPIVPRLFPAGPASAKRSTAGTNDSADVARSESSELAREFLTGPMPGAVYLTPAAVCRHITFAVAAEYALNSAVELRKLLDAVPGSSLTIFCGVGSLGITPATVQALISTYGKGRVFLDLKLSKAWRSCSRGSCAVQ